MSEPPPPLPEALAARLVRVERAALVERYRAALRRINGLEFTREAFTVDAAGYSPELAAELGDPHYLGNGPAHPAFVILSTAQLDAPLVQPNAGFSRDPYLGWIADLRAELADLTQTEPVFGELSHGVSRFTHPAQLGMVRGLSVSVHTPSERLGHARELGEMKRELLDHETRWQDEDFLARMGEHARHARNWVGVPPTLVQGSSLSSGPAYVPVFDGCYVWPGGDPPDPVAWVLCRAAWLEDAETWPALARASGVELVPLTPKGAADFMVARQLLDPRPQPFQLDLDILDELRTWIALDHLGRAGRLDARSAEDPLLAMRKEESPPIAYLELEDLRLKLNSGRGPIDLSPYSPITRLRVMPRLSGTAEGCAWVRHLRAFLDPLDLPGTARHAPDLLPLLLSHVAEPWASRRLASSLAAHSKRPGEAV